MNEDIRFTTEELEEMDYLAQQQAESFMESAWEEQQYREEV